MTGLSADPLPDPPSLDSSGDPPVQNPKMATVTESVDIETEQSSYGFSAQTDQTRKEILKKGTTKHRTLPLTRDAPAEDHYDMTTLEKKAHETLTEYNRSRGVDVDSIKEIRDKKDPYREPKSTYMKILNDHDMANRRANPKTSTPLKKRVSIEGDGDDNDGDNDDDDKSSKGKNDKSDDIDKKPSNDRLKFDNDLNETVNPFFSPKRKPTSNKGLNSSRGESVGDCPKEGDKPDLEQGHRTSDDDEDDDRDRGGRGSGDRGRDDRGQNNRGRDDREREYRKQSPKDNPRGGNGGGGYDPSFFAHFDAP